MAISNLVYDERVVKLSILLQRKRLKDRIKKEDLFIEINIDEELLDKILASNISYDEIPSEAIEKIAEFLLIAPVSLHVKTGKLRIRDFISSRSGEKSEIHDSFDNSLETFGKFLMRGDEIKGHWDE